MTDSKDIKSPAKHLRKNLTEAERALWKHLRARQMNGFRFRRQAPIGRYVVDFVCYEKRSVIEVDGGQHALSEKDAVRDEWLKQQGFSALRYWNNDVLKNTDAVLEVIRRTASTLP